MTVNLAALVAFLASLPVVRNLPTGVKKVLGDIITVGSALTAVLAVFINFTTYVHVAVPDLAYIVAAGSVVSALVALARRETQNVATAQAEATKRVLPT
jgi:hydroxyethylthiazole kinase-like sugar kinase family protein